MGKDVNEQLYCIDPEGKVPPQKLAGQDAAQSNFIPAWSPDGKTIVYAYGKGAVGRRTKGRGTEVEATIVRELIQKTMRRR